jgi:hypothetical protein
MAIKFRGIFLTNSDKWFNLLKSWRDEPKEDDDFFWTRVIMDTGDEGLVLYRKMTPKQARRKENSPDDNDAYGFEHIKGPFRTLKTGRRVGTYRFQTSGTVDKMKEYAKKYGIPFEEPILSDDQVTEFR